MTAKPEDQATTQSTLHRRKVGAAVTKVASLILGELSRRSGDSIEVRIIANVVARSIRTAHSIILLCDSGDVQSAWVLHRTLVERLFHLAHLSSTNTYTEFERWSFFEQAKRQKKSLSDPLFRDRVRGPEYQLTESQEKRFAQMLKQPPKWKRAQPEDMAKHMGIKFIYDYAYDFASMQIHPMANDGEIDLIAPHADETYLQTKGLVIDNSLLALTLLLQEAMNARPLNWCRAAYAAVDAVRRYIHDPSEDYETPLRKSIALLEIDGLSGFSQGSQ